MKILHITTSNRGGGAAIAATRHSEVLQRKGIDSVVLAEKGNKWAKDNLDSHLYVGTSCT